MVKKEEKRKEKIKDAQLHISVNKEEKEEAQRILEECGTTINSVVQMLMKYIINHKGIPFSVTLPEDITDGGREEVIKTERKEEKELIVGIPEESFWKEHIKDIPEMEKVVVNEEIKETKIEEEEEMEFLNLFE